MRLFEYSLKEAVWINVVIVMTKKIMITKKYFIDFFVGLLCYFLLGASSVNLDVFLLLNGLIMYKQNRKISLFIPLILLISCYLMVLDWNERWLVIPHPQFTLLLIGIICETFY